MPSSTCLKKLFIVGGSGFLGSHICHEAVQSGWKVFSLSRSGGPPQTLLNQPLSSHHWVNQVSWLKGDVNNPSSYSKYLEDVSAVIHSVGVLFENSQYQKLALRPISTLSEYISNPFSHDHARHPSSQKSSPDAPSDKRTYDVVNRDTALILASTVAQYSNVKTFTYISACHQIPPFLPERYITSKIEAENALCSMDNVKTIIFRPGVMYSADRPASIVGAGSFTLSNAFCYLPLISSSFPWLSVRPLPVSKVAKAALQAILKAEKSNSTPSTTNFVYEIADIADLSEEAY